MLGRQDIKIEISEKAMDVLADLGYDPQFGARPMKRVLQKEVVDKLSRKLLAGEFVAGTTIYVHADRKDALIFDDKPHPGQNSETATKVKAAAQPTKKAPTVTKVTKTVKKPSAVKPKTKEELLAEKAKRQKQLDALKKATKDVEKTVKEIQPKKKE